MARRVRIHYPGACFHVMLRGNAKQEIFQGPGDIRRFEEILGEGVARYGVSVYAYCWMPNHVHMAVQVSDIPLSKMMQSLSQRYTGWVNHKYERVGHLFQGRYKAVLVAKLAYQMELIRYIHLNPVRAGLVKTPEAYGNSSHREYLAPEQGRTVSWLDIDAGMALFGGDPAAAGLRYRHFMGEPVDEDRLMQLRTGVDTDNEPKIRTREDTIDIDLETLIRRVADEMDVTEEMISGPGRSRKASHTRAMIAILAMDHTAHTLYKVAARLNRDVSTLSKQVAHLRDRRQKFDRLDSQIKQLVKIIK
ncbi:transposase [Desulfotignum phosphitoxidans]|uniref:Transposase IS200-family protein n=1 Tax=Desulfotignum phosphitoxidans DSM 13687 TaxID=1286635 RepID=S0G1Y6_9BACT|nr:transposase [Desulfotignum phosphitoxidans]EMS77691.1 transposase IS200-family protein [Desulfotignum phosphitoxidans DSM 13687]